MQQTQTYKLNKPGIDDPLAIAPLNENADALDAALNGLNQRILTLENCRILLGTYYGIPTMKERRTRKKPRWTPGSPCWRRTR